MSIFTVWVETYRGDMKNRIEITFFFYKFIYLFLAVLGLRCCVRAFSKLWQAGATLHRGARASHYRGLSCCGAQAPHAQAQ